VIRAVAATANKHRLWQESDFLDFFVEQKVKIATDQFFLLGAAGAVAMFVLCRFCSSI